MREMKDSGVAWIGKIPESWNIVPAGGLFKEIKEKNTALNYTNPLQFKYGSIIDKSYVGELDSAMLETLRTYTCVEPNTIMINGLNLNYDFVSQRVAIVEKSGVITSAYLAVKPDERRILAEYACYLFKGYDGMQVFHGMGSGIRKTLQWKDFKNIHIILPFISEQSKIAAHLDHKCTQIDALISNAQQQIEKLKAYKQSVITETVTKGLDPDVEMKDSGNIFIGKIPEHWESMKLKYLCNMQAGKNLVSEQIAPTGEYKVYGGNGVRGFFNDFNCNGEYLLVGRQGALCGNVHYVNGKFWATEHAVITTSKTNNELKFLFYLLTGMNLNQYVSPTAAQPGLAVGSIQAIISCLPPLAEQRTIVTYLDHKCTQIDKLIALKQQKIEKLQQYKKSLIYEYVTGKKEVI